MIDSERDVHSDTSGTQLLLWSHLKGMVPLSRSTIWRRMRSGDFPVPVKLSPGRVAWREHEIRDWIRRLRRRP